MVEVVIDIGVAGMDLSTEAKEWLYENAKEKFFGQMESGPFVEDYNEPKTLDPDRFKWDFEYNQLYDEATQGWWHFNENGALGNMPDDWEARTDEDLIHAVEEFGGGEGLKIVEVPEDAEWYVDEHEDGSELVREDHRVWA